MLRWLKHLDRILRGEATRLPDLRTGTIDVPAVGLTVVVVLLGIFYGLCMGSFAVISGRAGRWEQMLASAIKVPALFVLTLIVTFPSLYVFNALVGSRLNFTALLRLLVAAMSVMLALLASFGTIVAFFSFTTESYHFMVLLNVVAFAVAGFLGLNFLLQTLHRMTVASERVIVSPPLENMPDPEGSPAGTPMKLFPTGALEAVEGREVGNNTKAVFRIWIIVFGLVGAQMSWVMRPFIGRENEFILFRPRGGNFFESVVQHLGHLFGWK
jgi:hypothetical protein